MSEIQPLNTLQQPISFTKQRPARTSKLALHPPWPLSPCVLGLPSSRNWGLGYLALYGGIFTHCTYMTHLPDECILLVDPQPINFKSPTVANRFGQPDAGHMVYAYQPNAIQNPRQGYRPAYFDMLD
jgi:hypothetical protein